MTTSTIPGFRDDVAGWLTEGQAAMLADAAAGVPPSGAIVEIGSFQGRSTIVLAAAAPDATVVAIDPHAGNDRGPGEIDGFAAEAAADRAAFERNLEQAGVRDRVRHVPAFSADAHAVVPGPIDLLYVDGAHGFTPARADLHDWGARVVDGGGLLVHNTFSSIGVTLAIGRELLFGRRFRFVGPHDRWRGLAPTSRRVRPPGPPTPAASCGSSGGSPATSPSRCSSRLVAGECSGVSAARSRSGRTDGRTGCGSHGAQRAGPGDAEWRHFAHVGSADVEGLRRLLAEVGGRGAIARGLGRSYGDSAQNAGGTAIELTDPAPEVELDPQRGTVTASAGTSLDVVLHACVPCGWFLPVTPGTRFVTVGGAIASDIHGKNHHVDGTFGWHVRELDMMLADGSVVTVGPDRWPELFWATVGGIGLTGVILRAS